jgi:hypothetical protein
MKSIKGMDDWPDDRQAYDLYGLTEEEIKIVERKE